MTMNDQQGEQQPLLALSSITEGGSLRAPPSSYDSSLKAPRHVSPSAYAKTYTAGEDASRLAEVARELGAQRRRQARKQVRSIDLKRVVDIMAVSSGAAPSASMIKGQKQKAKFGDTVAGVAGNILEWYDFAVFGYFGDIIGQVFFPPDQGGNTATMESFAVFGGAFLARPLGGVLLGYLGDVYGSKVALTVSIFLMAFPTFAMGCLPSFAAVGYWAPFFLVLIRLAQGMSVGGQLMSSLVFTLENSPPGQWGLYGSFVFATGNLGTLLGGLTAYVIRANLTHEQLVKFGWRIPFLAGVVVSFAGFYLNQDDGHGGHGSSFDEDNGEDSNDASALDEQEEQQDKYDVDDETGQLVEDGNGDSSTSKRVTAATTPKVDPLAIVFQKENLRPLLAAATVPMLWSTGFYLTFVWMPIYMTTMAEADVPNAFAANSLALLVSIVILFPFAGWLSDYMGRRWTMSLGGVAVAVASPFVIRAIGQSGSFGIALAAQAFLGVCLSFWGAPECAWLVEAFPPEARLTSMAVGYNVALAIVGGLTPALATFMVDAVGPTSPGWIYSIVAFVSMFGLWVIAPSPSSQQAEK